MPSLPGKGAQPTRQPPALRSAGEVREEDSRAGVSAPQAGAGPPERIRAGGAATEVEHGLQAMAESDGGG